MELPDNHEERVEKAREVLEEGNYQNIVSFLSAAPDAPAATGDSDEVAEKLEGWIEENADAEPDLEVVDGGGSADDETDDQVPAETDDAEPVADGGDAEAVEAKTPDDVDDYDSKAEEAERRTQHVREIREQERELFFSLACELYVVREKALYHYVDNPETGEPYQTMKGYVENETAHAQRTATYLMGLWEYYVVDYTEGYVDDDELAPGEQWSTAWLDELQDIGWTKLKELVDVITPETTEKWKTFCQNHSFSELKDELKALEEGDDEGGAGDEPGPEGETSQTERVTFELTDDQIPAVRDAVEIAKTLGETDNKSEALSLLCTDYVAQNQDTLQRDQPLSETLERTERTLGGEIVFFRRRDDQLNLLYGRETLQELASQQKQKAKQQAGGDAAE